MSTKASRKQTTISKKNFELYFYNIFMGRLWVRILDFLYYFVNVK